MLITNWKTCPGAGDIVPRDNSVREEAREEAIEVIADAVLDEMVADEAMRGEAMTALTDDEYAEINRAYAAGPASYWRATQTALRRVLRAAALHKAKAEVDVIDRQDERAYAAMRMEH